MAHQGGAPQGPNDPVIQPGASYQELERIVYVKCGEVSVLRTKLEQQENKITELEKKNFELRNQDRNKMGKGGGGHSSAGGMATGSNSAEINKLETQLKFERKAKADGEQSLARMNQDLSNAHTEVAKLQRLMQGYANEAAEMNERHKAELDKAREEVRGIKAEADKMTEELIALKAGTAASSASKSSRADDPPPAAARPSMAVASTQTTPLSASNNGEHVPSSRAQHSPPNKRPPPASPPPSPPRPSSKKKARPSSEADDGRGNSRGEGHQGAADGQQPHNQHGLQQQNQQRLGRREGMGMSEQEKDRRLKVVSLLLTSLGAQEQGRKSLSGYAALSLSSTELLKSVGKCLAGGGTREEAAAALEGLLLINGHCCRVVIEEAAAAAEERGQTAAGLLAAAAMAEPTGATGTTMHTSTGKVTATGEALQLADANSDGPHDILGQAMDLLRHESARGAGGDACVSLVHALTAVAACANEEELELFLPIILPAGCGPLSDVCRDGSASSRSSGYELFRELSRCRRTFEACIYGEAHVLSDAVAVLREMDAGLERAQEAAIGVFTAVLSGQRDGTELLERAGVLDAMALSCGLITVRVTKVLAAGAGSSGDGLLPKLRLVRGAIQILGQVTLHSQRDTRYDDAWYPLVRALTQLSKKNVHEELCDLARLSESVLAHLLREEETSTQLPGAESQ